MFREIHVAVLISFVCLTSASVQPNIVTIIADDLGWNDVGFHGSNQIPTPNIDALAYNGVILNRHYTLPTCTPSRTALLTGIYPIRTGMQGYPLRAGEPRGLPLRLATLPERLKQLGYVTRIIGKWHQGSFKTEYTPTRRGFDSFLGYWNGYNSYFSDELSENGRVGFNFRRDMCTTRDYVGMYATDVFTQEAVSSIRDHDVSKPLYLHIGHLAVHTGNNNDPLEVPDKEETHRRFHYINTPERRLFAGMLSKLDESVGLVMKALAEKGIINNTVVVFASDNGAISAGGEPNYGSNWPLRGLKFTLHEGGVRNVAAVWSARFRDRGRVSNQLFHLTDWLPTLYSAAGGNVSGLKSLDGVDQWDSLVGVEDIHPRTQVLLNIDSAQGMEALIDGRWKIAKGDYKHGVNDGYYGDDGLAPENPEYNITEVMDSLANVALGSVKQHFADNKLPYAIDDGEIRKLREEATVRCSRRLKHGHATQKDDLVEFCTDYCLYDIVKDPCEYNNLAADEQGKISEMTGILDKFRLVMVDQLNAPVDPAADPVLHNDTWVSWLDEAGSICSTCEIDL